ncbi:serine-rich adhesin for platelets [Rosa chinensis]|uniref:serine-rich adhesin for platelets n=1 Tax=Rosa chinensis TaxID=74649 RepID=UPI000D095732|nr:serine-rich adhesin for platelets [Rosa chinensis]XP_040372025.1 serine-rich adhesin for platelets [Rosa chinensis]
MIATSKEDGKLSDRKMEGDEGMRTLECLRGRLLAERQASRVAKEDAESMAKKLIELQNRLKEETKLKNKAEKKLKFLKTKLESLKPSSVPVESEQSSSSECSETSRRQSTSTSSSNNPEDNEPKPTVKDSNFSGTSSQNQVVKSTTSEKSHESDLFTEENSTAQSTSPASSSTSSLEFPSPEYSGHKSEDSKSGDHISYSNQKSTMEKIENENGNLDYVDNKLALVPVIMPATSHTSTTDLKPVSASVREVLDVLRHIRENIQSSMEKRHVTRVTGPTDQTQTCK